MFLRLSRPTVTLTVCNPVGKTSPAADFLCSEPSEVSEVSGRLKALPANLPGDPQNIATKCYHSTQSFCPASLQTSPSLTSPSAQNHYTNHSDHVKQNILVIVSRSNRVIRKLINLRKMANTAVFCYSFCIEIHSGISKR